MNKNKKAKILALVSALIDSDTDEEISICVNNYLHSKNKKQRLAIENYVQNVALMYAPDDFKSHFRLRRDTFEQVLEVLAPHLKSSNCAGIGRPTEAPDKQLLITLSMLANQNVYRNISELFNVSKSTAWAYVHKICRILVMLSRNFIKWPVGLEAVRTMRKFEEKQGFVNVIGAIDGSHISITAPKCQQQSYCNRKKYHSIILQAVCNADYKFTDVFAGFPGSAHDARVFRNSDLGKKMADNPEHLFPHDSHLLADSAYANTRNVLTPFRNNGHLTRVQKNYNYKHAASRVCIEQSFGLLKGRFRTLKHVNIYQTKLIPPLIVACCVLHNICMSNNDMIEPDVDNEDDNPDVPYTGHNTELNKRNYIAQMLLVK